MKQFFTLLAVLIVCVSAGFGSSVTKTVGVGQDYTTIADALADVNTNGLADTVTLMLMDTLYNETSLMYNPSTSQPLSLYVAQGGVAKPHVRVAPGGLPYALMAVNHAEFVMYNIIIEPDVSSSWLAGVNVRSMEEDSRVYIQSGGVTGSTTQRGYDVLADSSSEVNIFGCLVIQVQSVGIYIELQNFAAASLKNGSSKRTSSFQGSSVKLNGNTVTDADTGMIMRSASGPMNTSVAQADSNTFENVKQPMEFDQVAAEITSFSHNSCFQPYYDTYRQVMNKIGAILQSAGKKRSSSSIGNKQFKIEGNTFTVGAVTGSIIEVDLSGYDVICSNNTLRSSSVSPVGVKITSLQGTGSKFTSDGNVLSGFDIGTQLEGLGELAEVRFYGGADTVMEKSIYLPNGHNISVFEVGSSSLSSSMMTRRNMFSMQKFASIKEKNSSSSFSPYAIDVTINNDSTVPCSFSISNSDFDWVGRSINLNRSFDGNVTISGNTSSLPSHDNAHLFSYYDFYSSTIGYASLPGMSITNNTFTGGSGIEIELNNELTNPNFGSFTVTGNTFDGSTSAMQAKAKRAELPPPPVEFMVVEDNTFTGTSIYDGIAFEFGDLDVIKGITFESNSISNTNVAFQYRAKRAEVQPNLDGIKTAELSRNTIQEVQVGFDFEFNPDSAGQANSSIPFFEPIEIDSNIFRNISGGTGMKAMQYRAKRAEVFPNIKAIKVTHNTIDAGGTENGIEIPFNSVGSLTVEDNTVSNSRVNFQFGSLATEDGIYDDLWTGQPLSVQRNTFVGGSGGTISWANGDVTVQNNTFTCTGMESSSSMPGNRYELQVRGSNRVRTASNSNRPDFSVLLGGNTFCDGDLIVDIQYHDLHDSPFYPLPVTITGNQIAGDININTTDTYTDISGNIFGNPLTPDATMMAGRKYELQVRACRCKRCLDRGLESGIQSVLPMLDLSHNTINNFEAITITADDSSSIDGFVRIDSNSVDFGETALANSSMAANRYEVGFRKSKTVTLVSSQSNNAVASMFEHTNNSIIGYSHTTVDVRDSSETLSADVSGNTFDASNVSLSSSSMALNRYEVSFKKSKTVTLASSNSGSVDPTSFHHDGNTVTGYAEVLFDVDDSTGLSTIDFTGNTFTALDVANGSSSMAAKKYELQVRRSDRVNMAGNKIRQGSSSAIGDWFTYEDNISTGFAEIQLILEDAEDFMPASIKGNTFTGTSTVSTNNQSSMAANKYEVSYRRGSKVGYATASSLPGSEWFTYSNNTVTGFSGGGLFDLENGGDVGTARLEGNTFGSTIASNNGKPKETSMAINRYELQVRSSNRVRFAGLSSNSVTAGDSVIVRNNTFNGLDGGGLTINASNADVYYPILVWVDANTLSSMSLPFTFELEEAELDSGITEFFVTGNVIDGGLSSFLTSPSWCNRFGLYTSTLSNSPSGSQRPNTFRNGQGLVFYRDPVEPIQFNYQNVVGNTMNIINRTNSQIDARYCWWGTTDSAEIASKMQGNVLFMPFLTDSVTTQVGGIAGVVYNDANFNYTRDSETGLEGWTVQLKVDGDVVAEQVTNVNGGYYFQDIPFDQYTVCLVPQDGYAYSENLNCGSVDFKNGTLFSVEFGVFGDSKKFRTFSADTLLSKKPVKIVFKSNVRTSLYPNTATALENTFARLGKNGATFLGVSQLDKNRAKNLAWLVYKKAADLGKLYTSAHSGTTYPIDSLRPVGKAAKKLKGGIKADRKQFNNPLFAEGVAFNLNIIASQLGITPSGFGELVFDSPRTLLGKKLHGMTLAEVANWLNLLMTNWDSLGVKNSSAYAELADFSMNVLKPLNDGFAATVDSSNSTIDTLQVTTGVPGITGGKKNPFAVRLLGVKTASEVGMVVYVPGNTPTVKIQDAGFSEDESTLPEATALLQNYPNPFNPTTVIRYQLSVTGSVTIKVYDMIGREVATILNNEEMSEGEYEINFDASSLTSGVYFYRINVVGEDGMVSYTDVKRMTLVK
jgi:hypothetical protein